MMSWSVSSLVQEVRSGRISPREVLDHYLEAAERLDRRFNAFTALDAAPRMPEGCSGGALAGAPIAVKDLFDQAGRITTAGSAFYRRRAQSSAAAVQRLEEAGAVVMGRTNLHEFAFGFSSENPWFGAVRNPWDVSLSAGGSSGGSAAAAAGLMAPAALGTDTGGSVRVPAALCGIIGLKVTNGRIPLDGVFPLAPTLDTVGPMTRSIEDARLLYRAMASPDPPGRPPAARVGPLSQLRAAVPASWLEKTPADRRTLGHFSRFCDELADLGAAVERVDAPGLAPDRNIFTIVGAETAPVHRKWLEQGLPYGGDVALRLRAAVRVTPDQHRAAAARRKKMQELARGLFEDYHLLLTPTVGCPRKFIGLDDMDIDGKPVFYREALSGFTALVNHLGCPALALPLDKPGTPPPSVQLVAPWWEEELLLSVGGWLERAGVAAVRNPHGAPAEYQGDIREAALGEGLRDRRSRGS